MTSQSCVTEGEKRHGFCETNSVHINTKCAILVEPLASILWILVQPSSHGYQYPDFCFIYIFVVVAANTLTTRRKVIFDDE